MGEISERGILGYVQVEEKEFFEENTKETEGRDEWNREYH